jgi:protein gp37
MAERTNIAWCDATVNFWWGCTKVSPGCDNCYAEDYNAFRGNGMWGPGAPRRPIKGSIGLVQRLQRNAATFTAEHGRPMRVFCQSMSDTFDNEVEDSWREFMWSAIEGAPDLRFMLLTKRLTNVSKMVPEEWKASWPAHVGLMVSVCTQQEAGREIVRLLRLKRDFGIPWVGISSEPLLEMIDPTNLRISANAFLNAMTGEMRTVRRGSAKAPDPEQLPTLDLIICGGESGKNARPMHPAWEERLRRSCAGTATAYFFKQWGHFIPDYEFTGLGDFEAVTIERDNNPFAMVKLDRVTMLKVGKGRSGDLIRGERYQAFPEALLK